MDLKGTAYWEIYGEVFQFFKAVLPVRHDQGYWDEVLQRGDSISRKYVSTPYYDFAFAQVAAVIGELERLAKDNKRQ